MDWNAALDVIRQALSASGENVAFYLGLAPDHLFDLVSELCEVIGAPAPVRYTALGMFDGRATLVEATRQVFGEALFPYFDIAGSDLVLSFGANFLETWLSPVAYTRDYSKFRRAAPPQKGRGYLVSFEPRRSQTSGVADEWYPVTPGSEGLVAQALGKLLAEKGWKMPVSFDAVDVDAAAGTAGITRERLEHVADLAANAARPLFIPGGNVAGHVGRARGDARDPGAQPGRQQHPAAGRAFPRRGLGQVQLAARRAAAG